MKFKFRLETLWKLRVAERERLQIRLTEALQADDILRDRIDAIEVELGEMEQELRTSAQPGLVNVDRLLATERYELVLAARREAVRRQRVQLAAEIASRREALVEADRQVKVLEKLREKQYSAFQNREQSLEVKRLDEIAQTQTSRRRAA